MSKGDKNTFFEIKQAADELTADIFIYGEITKWAWEELGEKSATGFKKELDKLSKKVKTIHLYVNSPGGSVFEGLAIHNMLKRHEAKVVVHVDAVAASIASVIAMAGDEIRMPANSMMMIHNAWSFAVGDARALRKAADDLERINNASKQTYLARNLTISEEELQNMLDEETWLSASECVECGFADVEESANDAAACIDDQLMKNYQNVPDCFRSASVKENNQLSAKELAERKSMAEEAAQRSKQMKLILGGM